MSDKTLRELERQWVAEQTEDNARELVRARLRTNDFPVEQLLESTIQQQRAWYALLNVVVDHDPAMATPHRIAVSVGQALRHPVTYSDKLAFMSGTFLEPSPDSPELSERTTL